MRPDRPMILPTLCGDTRNSSTVSPSSSKLSTETSSGSLTSAFAICSTNAFGSALAVIAEGSLIVRLLRFGGPFKPSVGLSGAADSLLRLPDYLFFYAAVVAAGAFSISFFTRSETCAPLLTQ